MPNLEDSDRRGRLGEEVARLMRTGITRRIAVWLVYHGEDPRRNEYDIR